MKKIRHYLIIALFNAIGFFVVLLVIDLVRGRFTAMLTEDLVVSILFGIMMSLFDFCRDWYKGKKGFHVSIAKRIFV